jgi:hypothetical protein
MSCTNSERSSVARRSITGPVTRLLSTGGTIWFCQILLEPT